MYTRTCGCCIFMGLSKKERGSESCGRTGKMLPCNNQQRRLETVGETARPRYKKVGAEVFAFGGVRSSRFCAPKKILGFSKLTSQSTSRNETRLVADPGLVDNSVSHEFATGDAGFDGGGGNGHDGITSLLDKQRTEQLSKSNERTIE